MFNVKVVRLKERLVVDALVRFPFCCAFV
jgi:hypothetical protein